MVTATSLQSHGPGVSYSPSASVNLASVLEVRFNLTEVEPTRFLTESTAQRAFLAGVAAAASMSVTEVEIAYVYDGRSGSRWYPTSALNRQLQGSNILPALEVNVLLHAKNSTHAEDLIDRVSRSITAFNENVLSTARRLDWSTFAVAVLISQAPALVQAQRRLPPSAPDSMLSTGAIAGIAVAAVLLAVGSAVVGVWMLYTRRLQRRAVSSTMPKHVERSRSWRTAPALTAGTRGNSAPSAAVTPVMSFDTRNPMHKASVHMLFKPEPVGAGELAVHAPSQQALQTGNYVESEEDSNNSDEGTPSRAVKLGFGATGMKSSRFSDAFGVRTIGLAKPCSRRCTHQVKSRLCVQCLLSLWCLTGPTDAAVA